MKQLNNGIKMKNKAITPLLIILLSMLTYAQNTYNVQPGVKNNQIVLELSNNSTTETIQIKSLPNPSPKGQAKGGAYERIKLTNEKEKLVELQPEETKEIFYTFDVDYNIGTTKSDTIEFAITDGNANNITKQFEVWGKKDGTPKEIENYKKNEIKTHNAIAKKVIDKYKTEIKKLILSLPK